MPGYEIFEKRHLKPYNADGIAPYDIRMGFLDFLREIKGSAEGIPPLSSFTISGIEEVLYRARPEERKIWQEPSTPFCKGLLRCWNERRYRFRLSAKTNS